MIKETLNNKKITGTIFLDKNSNIEKVFSTYFNLLLLLEAILRQKLLFEIKIEEAKRFDKVDI